MSTICDKIENAVNRFLQQKVHFYVNGKLVKTGKLILFSIKDFYLVFTINIHHHRKTVEIPYPFAFCSEPGKITFNYDLQHLHHHIPDIVHQVKLLSPKKPNKFFDSHACIAIVEESSS